MSRDTGLGCPARSTHRLDLQPLQRAVLGGIGRGLSHAPLGTSEKVQDERTVGSRDEEHIIHLSLSRGLHTGLGLSAEARDEKSMSRTETLVGLRIESRTELRILVDEAENVARGDVGDDIGGHDIPFRLVAHLRPGHSLGSVSGKHSPMCQLGIEPSTPVWLYHVGTGGETGIPARIPNVIGPLREEVSASRLYDYSETVTDCVG